MKSGVSNRRRLFYTLALVASVVGLLLDRMYRTNISEAAAKTASATAIQVATATNENLVPEGPPIAAIFESVSDPLDGTSGEDDPRGEVRDAFSLSPRMRSYYEANSKRADQAKAKSREEERAEIEQHITDFKRAHPLQGTFMFPDDRWVVIDNQILRIDDQLDGFTLRAIGHYRVTFVRDGIKVVIALPDTENLQGTGEDTR